MNNGANNGVYSPFNVLENGYFALDTYNMTEGTHFYIGKIDKGKPIPTADEDDNYTYYSEITHHTSIEDCIKHAKMNYGNKFLQAVKDDVIQPCNNLSLEEADKVKDILQIYKMKEQALYYEVGMIVNTKDNLIAEIVEIIDNNHIKVVMLDSGFNAPTYLTYTKDELDNSFFKGEYKGFTIEKVNWSLSYKEETEELSPNYLVYMEIEGENYYFMEQSVFSCLNEAKEYIDSYLEKEQRELLWDNFKATTTKKI